MLSCILFELDFARIIGIFYRKVLIGTQDTALPYVTHSGGQRIIGTYCRYLCLLAVFKYFYTSIFYCTSTK